MIDHHERAPAQLLKVDSFSDSLKLSEPLLPAVQVDRTLYVCIVLLGVGSVLPTFVIFAAVDYFETMSPDMMVHVNLAYNGMLFMAAFANASAKSLESAGFTIRIIWGFVGIGACMGSLPVLEHFRGGPLSEEAFEIATGDVPNWYHRLGVPPQIARHFGLDRVTTKGLKEELLRRG